MLVIMGALSGVKVLDFSRILAGPYATMLMADMGADVVKVERPGVGDDTRTWGPPFNAEGNATYFQSINRNKRGITANLSLEEDRLDLIARVRESDVLVENFVPGTMERYGLGYETLKEINPGLVYCSISGFGDSAEAKELAGYDLLVQGLSGLMSITGDDPSHPMKVGVAVVDVIAGLHALSGILAALHQRTTSGIGQKVSVNLLSSALSGMVNQTGAFSGAGVIPKPLGNAHPSIAPYQVYSASDKQFIIAIGNDHQFAKFCEVLELHLHLDPKFATNSNRVAHRYDLNEHLGALFATHPSDHWVRILTALKIPVGTINNIGEAIAFAESIGLHPVVEVIDPRDQSLSRTIANPITFSATPVEYRFGPPALGIDDQDK